MRYAWNDGWQFSPTFTPALCGAQTQELTLQEVRLPHTNTLLPLHYFDERRYQTVTGYRRVFTLPQAWVGKQLLLTFEGVAHQARVFCNGTQLAHHRCGYTAFTVDLAPCAKPGENVLAVEVDSTEDGNIPPFGHVIDYLTFGGIYREVYLEIKEPQSIDDVFVTTPHAHKASGALPLQVFATVRLEGEPPLQGVGGLRLRCTVWDEATQLAAHESAAVPGAQQCTFAVPGARLWDTQAPCLYTLRTQLLQGEAELDCVQTRFGFRTCKFGPEGFTLNGKPLKLRGLNRHQSYPYTGYAMPAAAQRADADILKRELGVNAVRTSHYPQSQHFLDRCDELGLLVFTEIPGWQHIGDAAWQQVACDSVRDMVRQYRNHPCIVLWGVRINESADSDDFYTQTNRIARAMDPTRQTGGVRCNKHSRLLEDVYTYNDFVHTGDNRGLAPKKAVTKAKGNAYLVSEHNGHMYPTKPFDDEAHRLSHALRHAQVLDDLYAAQDIAGAFGWCMFDYNTHQDFGSGDKICYHGVLDAFRNPKLAAAVYASQGEERDVLEISSTMDIGEHAAGSLGAVYAFTNADCVRLYRNDVPVSTFTPQTSPYPHLPHPPILIDDFIGDALERAEGFAPRKAARAKAVLRGVARYGQKHLPLRLRLKMLRLLVLDGFSLRQGEQLYGKYMGNWGGAVTQYRFDAVKNGVVVKSVLRAPVCAVHLEAQASHTALTERESYDMACVRLRICDQNGNTLPYWQGAVCVQTEGPLELVGPAQITLAGGTGGVYVKTTGKSGQAVLTLQATEAAPLQLRFSVSVPKQL